jgi:hypothetical protein
MMSAAASIGPGRVANGHRARAGRVQHALADHHVGAAVALFARLEHEDHVPGQLGLPGAEQPGRPGQHGRVQVVPAGVHHALEAGGVGQAGGLGDRQRVHVAPQQDRRPRLVTPAGAGPGAAEHGRHRAELAPGADLQWQPGQGVQHLGLGQRQLQADLGLAVDGVPQLGQFPRDRRRVLAHPHQTAPHSTYSVSGT